MYEIQKLHAASDVALGYGNDKTEIGLGKAALGFFVAVEHAACERGFFVAAEQRHSAYVFEINLDGVVYGNFGNYFIEAVEFCVVGSVSYLYALRRDYPKHLFHLLRAGFADGHEPFADFVVGQTAAARTDGYESSKLLMNGVAERNAFSLAYHFDAVVFFESAQNFVHLRHSRFACQHKFFADFVVSDATPLFARFHERGVSFQHFFV